MKYLNFSTSNFHVGLHFDLLSFIVQEENLYICNYCSLSTSYSICIHAYITIIFFLATSMVKFFNVSKACIFFVWSLDARTHFLEECHPICGQQDQRVHYQKSGLLQTTQIQYPIHLIIWEIEVIILLKKWKTVIETRKKCSQMLR